MGPKVGSPVDSPGGWRGGRGVRALPQLLGWGLLLAPGSCLLSEMAVAELPDAPAEPLDEPAIVRDGQDRPGEIGQRPLERL